MGNDELYETLSTFLNEDRLQKFDKIIRNRTRHFTVAVENLFQSHNASAVMRSCDCFGIQDLHIIANYNKYKLSKDVAMGAEKWVDMHSYHKKENNTQDCIDTLRAQGYQIVATSPHTKEVLLPDFDISQKSAFFFGTERSGLSNLVLDQADVFVKIPMYGFTESYNISVSASLVLHDTVTRLHKSKIDWRLSDRDILEKKIAWAVKSLKSGDQILEQLTNKS